MSFNLTTKYRIIEKDNLYYLQEKRFFRWKYVFQYGGLDTPFGFSTIDNLERSFKENIWWNTISETRIHDDELFIRDHEKLS